MASIVTLSRAEATERRIGWLILVFGALAAVAVSAATLEFEWAAGLAIGAVLAWLNYRWLRQGMDALVIAARVQEGAEKPRVPIGSYFRALFRYALIALCVYVIFKTLKIPAASMVIGLCVLGPAAMVASLLEALRPARPS
jgi:ATP synthase I subunit